MAQSKYGYIPSGIQKSMDQHLQRMPANLQKYQTGNTYIPAHAAKQMENYMKKSMPAHMQDYIKPYMQQKTTAGLNSLDPVRSRPMQEKAPVPNLMRRDHSAFGQQFSVELGDKNKSTSSGSLSYLPQYTAADNNAQAPQAPPPAPLPAGSQGKYDFIMNANQPKGGFGSMKQRLIMAVVGGVVLLILLIVIFGLIFGSGSNSAQKLTALAQQQTEIARVADIGVQKATSAATKNLAYTTKLSLLSSQQQTVALLNKQGKKLKPKQLSLMQSSVTDQKLNEAATNNTFDTTFTKLLTDELNSYRTDVLTEYRSSTSPTERQILQDSFDGVSLLVSAKST